MYAHIADHHHQQLRRQSKAGVCEKAPRRALVACADLRPRGNMPLGMSAEPRVGEGAGGIGAVWRTVVVQSFISLGRCPCAMRWSQVGSAVDGIAYTFGTVARRTGRTVALAAVQNCMRSICALSTPNTVDSVYPEPDRQDPGKRYRFPRVVGMRHGVGHGPAGMGVGRLHGEI